MLNSLGIDEHTQSVYQLMLADPQAGVKDIGQKLGLDSDQVKTALERLVDLSLVDVDDDRVEVHSPELALPALHARNQAELAQRNQDLEDSRIAMMQFLTQYGGSVPTSGPEAERLVGSDDVRAKIAELGAAAVDQVLNFSQTGRMNAEALEAAKAVTEDLRDRGVRYRDIYLDSVRNHEETYEYVQWMQSKGVEVRTLPSLPLRMVVFDGKAAIIPLSNDLCTAGGLLLRNEVVIEALIALFSEKWKEAAPLTRTRPRRKEGLSAQERHALRLWALGLTDEAVARRMEVSFRTVRRIHANLTERLGAISRFHLGALALSKGWISADDLA
ncbi:helix-turn-helix transcriptional regulator [Salininema proteolyticum]|uniref:LuxR C-terminal-related transcriptional regulator n=1 Tax=Salininema proteolyticum TaxID=1607685 RepID=A0ABV8TTL8_9ACTN